MIMSDFKYFNSYQENGVRNLLTEPSSHLFFLTIKSQSKFVYAICSDLKSHLAIHTTSRRPNSGFMNSDLLYIDLLIVKFLMLVTCDYKLSTCKCSCLYILLFTGTYEYMYIPTSENKLFTTSTGLLNKRIWDK